jgi:protein-S-isoprenylcysteine O-methyltransferase Ste14
MVICGGLTTVIHYVYVWRRTRRLSEPNQLITEFGLFRCIRHPMYTGDLITYSGLLFLAPGPVSVLVLCIGTYAIWRQSIVEDRYMAERFGASHRQWRNRTSLLIPGL